MKKPAGGGAPGPGSHGVVGPPPSGALVLEGGRVTRGCCFFPGQATGVGKRPPLGPPPPGCQLPWLRPIRNGPTTGVSGVQQKCSPPPIGLLIGNKGGLGATAATRYTGLSLVGCKDMRGANGRQRVVLRSFFLSVNGKRGNRRGWAQQDNETTSHECSLSASCD